MKPIKITLSGLIFEIKFKASGLFKVYTVNKVTIIPTNINANIIPVKNEDIGFLGLIGLTELTELTMSVLKKEGFFKESLKEEMEGMEGGMEEEILFFNDNIFINFLFFLSL